MTCASSTYETSPRIIADDIANFFQLSFQVWTSQIQETLNCKKHGDTAFRAKDFATAIKCYTQVIAYNPRLIFSESFGA